MKKFLSIFFLLLFMVNVKSYAQGEAAVPFVLIHPSPHLNGMAGAFTALPTDNPFGQYFNPAQLAYFARYNNFATEFYLESNWLPQFNFSDLYFISRAFALGYTSNNLLQGVPVSIGLGFLSSKLNLGKNVWTDENGNELGVFESKETYRQFSFGLGLDWFVKFNIGFALKNIHSNLGTVAVGDQMRPGNSKARTFDYGFLFTVPTMDLLKFQFNKSSILANVQPFLDFSFGASVRNIGDKMNYIDKDRLKPLPRMASMGYGLSMGFRRNFRDITVQLFKADWASEARNLLIDIQPDGNWKYVAFPGDIKLDNILLGKYNRKITVYQGYRFKLLESVEYSFGYFRRAGDNAYIKTHGILISSQGISKFLSAYLKNRILNMLLEKIVINYAWSEYFSTDRSNPLKGTSFKGLTITLKSLF